MTRFAEPGVRSSVAGADVRLDLHDPADSPARWVVADEPRTDQAVRGLERRPRQDGAVEDAQLKV